MAAFFKYDNSNEFGLYEHKNFTTTNDYIPDVLDYKVQDYFYFQYNSFLSRNGGSSNRHVALPLTQVVL